MTLCRERRVREGMTEAYKTKKSVGNTNAELLFIIYHSTRSRGHALNLVGNLSKIDFFVKKVHF